jgi:putative (di)nucleoside polyphosphate hydrolase
MSKSRSGYNQATFKKLLRDRLARMAVSADEVTERQLVDTVTGILNELSAGSFATPTKEASGRSERDYRPAVIILLLNKHNQVFVGRRRNAVNGDVWQLPQSAISRGEDPRGAAMRVLRRQLEAQKIEVLAESKSWLFYELLVGLTGRVRRKGGRGQRQKWFIMRLITPETRVNVDPIDPDYCDWKWISISELPKHIVSLKKLVYLNAVEEFVDAIGPYPDDTSLLT